MSAGTFTLNPGPPTPGLEAGNFAGTQVPGTLGGLTTPVASLVGDLATFIRAADSTTIRSAYMRACREFCARSRWLKRNITNTALTINQPVYNFGTDPNLEVIGVSAAAIQQQNLTWVGLRSTSQDTADPNQAPDLPNWFMYLDEGMIRFYPTPNLAYLSNVNLIVQTSLNGTAVPNDLIAKWNREIEFGALAFLYDMPKEEWSDPVKAGEARIKFIEGWAAAKSWVDKGYQQGSVRATPRPFLSR